MKTSAQTTPVTVPPTHVELPDLYTLRQDANIKCQVDQRLKDLASNDSTGTKIKSLRGGGGGGGPVEVLVQNADSVSCHIIPNHTCNFIVLYYA